MLIVFDKVFGTYVPEREHLDYYGLAKQYETFDPVRASIEHGARVMNNVDQGGGSVMSLLRRRVKHKWVVDFPALFRRVPKPEKSPWILPTQPYRTKLNTQVPFVLNVYLCAQFFLQLISFLKLSDDLQDGHITLGPELAIRQVLALSAMSCIGRLFDGFSKGRSSNLIRVILTPIVIACALESRGRDAWLYYASLLDFLAFFLVSMHLVGTKH